MTAYFDSSFLISLYTADTNSTSAAGYATSAPLPFPLTRFGCLELINAIHLRHFRHEITLVEAKAALAAVESDLTAGVFLPSPAPANMYELARTLAGKHTSRLGTRSLDVLHVAVALELQTKSFFTFDRRQARLARAEGLSTPVRIR